MSKTIDFMTMGKFNGSLETTIGPDGEVYLKMNELVLYLEFISNMAKTMEETVHSNDPILKGQSRSLANTFTFYSNFFRTYERNEKKNVPSTN